MGNIRKRWEHPRDLFALAEFHHRCSLYERIDAVKKILIRVLWSKFRAVLLSSKELFSNNTVVRW